MKNRDEANSPKMGKGRRKKTDQRKRAEARHRKGILADSAPTVTQSYTPINALGYDTYQDYLLSPIWFAIREIVFQEKGRSCCLCGKYATQVHHDNYNTETMSGEDTSGLFPICKPCHHRIEHDPQGRKVTGRKVRRAFAKARQERFAALSAAAKSMMRVQV